MRRIPLCAKPSLSGHQRATNSAAAQLASIHEGKIRPEGRYMLIALGRVTVPISPTTAPITPRRQNVRTIAHRGEPF